MFYNINSYIKALQDIKESLKTAKEGSMKSKRELIEDRKKFARILSEIMESSASAVLSAGFNTSFLNVCIAFGGYSGLVEVTAETVYRARPGGSAYILPLEAGLSVHPVYLVPYVPGSSVKGVARAAFLETAILRGVEAWEAERCARAVFGDTEDAGVSALVFFDAYPVGWDSENGLLWGDVVTPHYPGARAEWEAQPRPALQLSLAPGVELRFTVLVDEPLLRERLRTWGCCWVLDKLPGGRHGPLGLAAGLLVYALERLGIGSKTTRGYGRLRVTGLRATHCTSANTRGKQLVRGR